MIFAVLADRHLAVPQLPVVRRNAKFPVLHCLITDLPKCKSCVCTQILIQSPYCDQLCQGTRARTSAAESRRESRHCSWLLFDIYGKKKVLRATKIQMLNARWWFFLFTRLLLLNNLFVNCCAESNHFSNAKN